jgi:hypothetical protein
MSSTSGSDPILSQLQPWLVLTRAPDLNELRVMTANMMNSMGKR